MQISTRLGSSSELSYQRRCRLLRFVEGGRPSSAQARELAWPGRRAQVAQRASAPGTHGHALRLTAPACRQLNPPMAVALLVMVCRRVERRTGGLRGRFQAARNLSLLPSLHFCNRARVACGLCSTSLFSTSLVVPAWEANCQRPGFSRFQASEGWRVCLSRLNSRLRLRAPAGLAATVKGPGWRRAQNTGRYCENGIASGAIVRQHRAPFHTYVMQTKRSLASITAWDSEDTAEPAADLRRELLCYARQVVLVSTKRLGDPAGTGCCVIKRERSMPVLPGFLCCFRQAWCDALYASRLSSPAISRFCSRQ